MNRLVLVLVFCVSWLIGCDDGGMRVPPAAQWKPPEVVPSVVGKQKTRARTPADTDDDDEAEAEAETDDESDPHAGLDVDDPHAGLDMEEDDLGGLEPPDPDRPIDPKKFLHGRIRAGANAGTIAPGAIVFLSAWPLDKNTGEVLGSPLAVEKLIADKLPLEFRLDERNMMVKGTQFAGDVIITARVDRDGEARTKEPGDVEGRARATIPADKIDLVLDTVLR